MRLSPFILLIPLVAATATAMPVAAAQANNAVTIYRCTDGKSRLTLRDSPCNKGERQETRNMLRPTDAPIRATLPAAVPTSAAVAPPPQIIVINNNTPRPMYECIAPDNQRYLSDTPEGSARWVPLWPAAYPITAHVPVYQPGQLNVSVNNGRLSGGYSSGGYHSGSHHSGGISRVLVPTYAEFGGGTWVRDPCHSLPQIEVCARVRDRRDEIRRRTVIAQPSERAILGREETSIGDRLSQDCR